MNLCSIYKKKKNYWLLTKKNILIYMKKKLDDIQTHSTIQFLFEFKTNIKQIKSILTEWVVFLGKKKTLTT